MFTFDATPVTFVGLLVLFAWCTVWCAGELLSARTASQRVSGTLHLAMAVVMLAMVPAATWRPLASAVGTPVLALLFGIATAWFVGLAAEGWRADGHRGAAHPAAHAAMFGAMTWHLVAMAIKAAHMQAMRSGHGMGGDWAAAESAPGGVLWLVALVGAPFMAYLLAAGVVALTRVFQPRAAANDACPCGSGCRCGPSCACGSAHQALPDAPRTLALVGAAAAPASGPITEASPGVHLCRVESPVGSVRYRLTACADAAMNLGMFWMSAGLMTALLPFFRYLAV